MTMYFVADWIGLKDAPMSPTTQRTNSLDRMFVSPVRMPESGLKQVYEYPDFRLLRTFQGLVVEPLSDDLEVKSLPTGIEVKRPAGLVSSDRDTGQFASQ